MNLRPSLIIFFIEYAFSLLRTVLHDNGLRVPISLSSIATCSPLIVIPATILYFAKFPWDSFQLLGLFITSLSLILLTCARLQLGECYSLEPKAKVLITSGIYSRIRHPIYFFSSCMLVGLAFCTRTKWIACLLFILIPVQICRAKLEDNVLRLAFGAKYSAYKRSTWF